MSGAPSSVETGGSVPRPESQAGGWSRGKWLMLIALVFGAEVGLVFALGQKQFPPSHSVGNKEVPHLALVNGSDELLALADPTLFVLPHTNDFTFSTILPPPPPSFHYAEPWQPLPLSPVALGAVFDRFMRTNPFTMVQLDLKPREIWSEPVRLPAPEFPAASTLEITGDLSQRPLLNEKEIHWPSLPFDDVLPPSQVRALVSAGGGVISAVLAPPENPADALGRANLGDTNALAIVRGLRFAPAPQPTVGVVIFHWITVPPPPASPPDPAP